jgi:hypothetical protein
MNDVIFRCANRHEQGLNGPCTRCGQSMTVAGWGPAPAGLADATKLVLALLVWFGWAPLDLSLAMVETCTKLLHVSDSRFATVAGEAHTCLSALSAEEQRELVYRVVRETFSAKEPAVWEAAAARAIGTRGDAPTDAALDLLWTDDDTLWIVLAHAAIACAARMPAMSAQARRARERIHPMFWSAEQSRAALAELLGGTPAETAQMRELLGVPDPMPAKET